MDGGDVSIVVGISAVLTIISCLVGIAISTFIIPYDSVNYIKKHYELTEEKKMEILLHNDPKSIKIVDGSSNPRIVKTGKKGTDVFLNYFSLAPPNFYKKEKYVIYTPKELEKDKIK